MQQYSKGKTATLISKRKNTDNLNILLVEDRMSDAELVKFHLQAKHPNWNIQHVDGRASFDAYISRNLPDIVLSDYAMPSFNGMEAFLTIKNKGLEIPFIMVTGELPEEVAVECIEEGIDDYIIKSSLIRLSMAIQKALSKWNTKKESKFMENALVSSEKRYENIFQNIGVPIIEIEKRNAFPIITKFTEGQRLSQNQIFPGHSIQINAFNSKCHELFMTDSKESLLVYFKRNLNINTLVSNSSKVKHKDEHSIALEGELTTQNLRNKSIIVRYTLSVLQDQPHSIILNFVDITEIVKSKKKIEKVMDRLEQTVKQRTQELSNVNEKLQVQARERDTINKVLRENYIQMTDSVIAAKRIQQLMLPDIKSVADTYQDAFIYLRPKDIVSGDFYWFFKKDHKSWLACVDCAGHGVPGGFMSMISSKFLNQVIKENNNENTDDILRELDHSIITELKQHEVSTQISMGLDISICCIDDKLKQLKFSGAFHQLTFVHKGQIEILKGDRFSLGGTFKMDDKKFTQYTRKFDAGDTFYMSTDGFVDQFGGPDNKKFMRKRFNKMLEDAQGKSMYDQESFIKNALQDWKGAVEQIDDILIMGVQL